MAIALRSSSLLKALISVDNAPVNAVLNHDFANYIRGMLEVEKAKVSKQAEADEILKSYEEVCSLEGYISCARSVGFSG